MKYGETIFDVLYLAFAIAAGIVLLAKSGTRSGRAMGAAALLLGVGDGFHLIPRVLNYFLDGDFTTALGVGKLVTSITMTVFYVMLYYIWIVRYRDKYSVTLSVVITALAAVRILLCAFPQNGWFDNTNNLVWSIVRNLPFAVLGGIVCYLFFKKRREVKCLSPIWIYVLLSFAFYLPVAVGAIYLPILGMLMLPKTVCYILMIACFLVDVRREKTGDQ